ncbi:beta-1,3-glucanase family protein [Actinoalloteichus spitiensis]|uniref:beta-1,3-glucanase family protein n=1 Tax=Actinoalloteichus spitiensis TaxID=252394 RepID=UPI000475002A|nr:beta-1,3-glucanase family protein [Actinoalloteichus spitiensis]
MVTRRMFLGGLAATAAGGALIGSGSGATASAPVAPAAARVPNSLPFTVVNDSGRYPNSALWMHLVGRELPSDRPVRMTPDGTLAPVSASDNGADGFADYAIPLNGAGDTRFDLPINFSGRVYFSVTEKIRFRVNPDDTLAYPAGWVESDPNYRILHDCMEFTYDATGMYCNTTKVDMFSMPLGIELTGSETQRTGFLVDGGREAVFAAMRDNPDFANLVVDDLRVIAPSHGIDSGLFSPTFYDSYVDAVWDRYQSGTLTVTANHTDFTGRVQDGLFTFTGGVSPFEKPTTRDVLFCDGALHAPNDGVSGPVAAVLGASLNRSTLLDSAQAPVLDPDAFYLDRTSNHYSRVLHENMVDGKVYGFAFDDVGDFASYVQDHAPAAITVSINPF